MGDHVSRSNFPPLLLPSRLLPPRHQRNSDRQQSPRPMATPPAQLDPPLLHRQHEPLRGHLHRQRGAAGAAGRRRHHRRPGRGSVPPHGAMGRGRYGEREAMPVDVMTLLGAFGVCVNQTVGGALYIWSGAIDGAFGWLVG